MEFAVEVKVPVLVGPKRDLFWLAPKLNADCCDAGVLKMELGCVVAPNPTMPACPPFRLAV